MSEPFNRGYLEWQRRMREDGYQVVSNVSRQDLNIPIVHACHREEICPKSLTWVFFGAFLCIEVT